MIRTVIQTGGRESVSSVLRESPIQIGVLELTYP